MSTLCSCPPFTTTPLVGFILAVSWLFIYLIIYFETTSHYVARISVELSYILHASLELKSLLPQTPLCWYYRHKFSRLVKLIKYQWKLFFFLSPLECDIFHSLVGIRQTDLQAIFYSVAPIHLIFLSNIEI